MRCASRGPNNDKERVMWLAAIQLVSGRHWQDNRARIDAELAALPARRPLLALLPENFALFGERQGYLDGAETIGKAHPAATGRLGQGARDLAGGRAMPTRIPGRTISTPAPWCSTRTVSSGVTTTRSTCSTWTWRTITDATGVRDLQPRRGACAGGLPPWSPRPVDLL